MIVYRCDRCGNDFQDKDELRNISLPHTDRWGKFTDELDKYSRELCNACWTPILELTKPIQGKN